MKIGVLTWKLHNFGTALQAYALVHYLHSHNAKDGGCALLNYSLPGKNGIIKLNPVTLSVLGKKIGNKARLLCGELRNRAAQRTYAEAVRSQAERFRSFYSSIPQDSHRVSMEESWYFNAEYEKIVVGSDQVWNPKFFCSTYFLDFVEDAKKFSYAASLGVSSLTDPEKQFLAERLQGHFQAVAVREKSGQRMLQELLPGQQVTCVLDPTLLFSGEEWSAMLQLKEQKTEPYILVYTLSDNPWYKGVIRRMQKQLNIRKVLCITPRDKLYFYEGMGEIVADAGPVEFLSLIKNAEHVITDSFHGVCFSVNFQKQFTCLERFDSKSKGHENARVTDFLRSLGIESAMTKRNAPITLKNICYNQVEKKLEAQKNDSNRYLRCILE